MQLKLHLQSEHIFQRLLLPGKRGAKARFSSYIERESTLYMNFTRLIYKDQREALTAMECFLIIGFGIKPPNWQILKAKVP